jgi:anti-sigma factor RsiW
MKKMTDPRAVLSALIDREAVDPDLLEQLLEDRSNRALLVDFVRVRAALQADEECEPAWRAPSGASALTRPSPSPRAWLRAAAALLLLAAGAGGGAWIEHQLTRERPPEPDRIVQLEPGDVSFR